jgi:hypothetical protein
MPLTRYSGRVEAMGFEPRASTLRTSCSRRYDQVLSEDFPGSGVSIPSGSLTILPLPSRKGHVRSRRNRVEAWPWVGARDRSAGRRKVCTRVR